jgi:L-aminopeptidase/D-esterase-like protein
MDGTGPANSITDVPGLRVGHARRVGEGWLTGCTVVLAPGGGSPPTRPHPAGLGQPW